MSSRKFGFEELVLIRESSLSNPFRATTRMRRREAKQQGLLPPDDGNRSELRAWWGKVSGESALADDAALALLVTAARTPGHPEKAVREMAQILKNNSAGRFADLALRAGFIEHKLKEMVGSSREMNKVRQDAWSASFGSNLSNAEGMAPVIRQVPIFISGETGSGKEAIAQAVVRSMPGRWSAEEGWAPAPHESVHLAASTKDLVNDRLFGHVKGGYTGADKSLPGIFERCDSGSVFLDEVAELQPEAQVALLRVIQEGKVERLGDHKPRKARVRMVSATHRDLHEMVDEGGFREDLRHRLASTAVIHVPPLRDRSEEDLKDLANAVIDEVDQDLQINLREQFLEFLAKHVGYSWPGNVRELHAVVRALALGLEPVVSEPRSGGAHPVLPPGIESGGVPLSEVKRWYIRLVVERSENLGHAAKTLGVHRNTVRAHLEIGDG